MSPPAGVPWVPLRASLSCCTLASTRPMSDFTAPMGLDSTVGAMVGRMPLFKASKNVSLREVTAHCEVLHAAQLCPQCALKLRRVIVVPGRRVLPEWGKVFPKLVCYKHMYIIPLQSVQCKICSRSPSLGAT